MIWPVHVGAGRWKEDCWLWAREWGNGGSREPSWQVWGGLQQLQSLSLTCCTSITLWGGFWPIPHRHIISIRHWVWLDSKFFPDFSDFFNLFPQRLNNYLLIFRIFFLNPSAQRLDIIFIDFSQFFRRENEMGMGRVGSGVVEGLWCVVKRRGCVPRARQWLWDSCLRVRRRLGGARWLFLLLFVWRGVVRGTRGERGRAARRTRAAVFGKNRGNARRGVFFFGEADARGGRRGGEISVSPRRGAGGDAETGGVGESSSVHVEIF